jgi:glycosyltransferase involved in cell wall biosynthesis
MNLEKKLNFTFGYNSSSFGLHGSYTLKYLTKLGWDVRHIPIGPTEHEPSFDAPNTEFHHDAPSLKLWHPNNQSGHTGSPTISFTNFELEDLTDVEIHNLKYPDLVLVPTRWGARVCEKYGISTKIVPLGYDAEIFRPSPPEPGTHTIFGNFGKWEIRKGHDVLIKAFNAAFEKNDEVTLVMMPTNGFLNSEQVRAWQRMYLESKLGDKVQIVPRVNTHQDVFNIMRQVDVAVFTSRAEGWNMEALEMMGCGKEVIITNCTGHTGFVNESCRLVDMKDEFETAYDGVFFGGFSKWRKFTQDSFDQLVEHMRNVHRCRPDLKLNQAAIDRASKFTWELSTNVLAKEISRTCR